MTAQLVVYEYTSGTCDVWQLHHLANHYADKGWEPVFAVETQPGIKVPSRVGDENGSTYEALRPYEVLFRRVLETEFDEIAVWCQGNDHDETFCLKQCRSGGHPDAWMEHRRTGATEWQRVDQVGERQQHEAAGS